MVGKIIRSLVWCGVVLAAVSGSRATAADFTWNGGTAGTWTSAANWLPSTTWSGSTNNVDTATFLAGAATTVTIPNNQIFLNALTVNRDLTINGTSSTFSTGTAYTQAANTSVTVGLTNASALFRMGHASSQAFNTLGGNAILTVNVSATTTGQSVVTLGANSLLTYAGPVNFGAGNSIYAGSGTVAYAAASGTSGGLKFYLNDTTNLLIKSTATATTGTTQAPLIAASGTNTVTLERNLDLMTPVTSGTAGSVVLGFSRSSVNPTNSVSANAAVTVTGPSTLSMNLLGINNIAGVQKLVVENGAVVQVGDSSTGKAQGVSMTNTSLAYFQNMQNSGTFQVDSASGGTLRVNADSSFNAATAASGSVSLGLGISVTGSATLVNNGAWTNRNFQTTSILQGLSVASTATLSGTGSFLMTSGNNGTAIGKSVALDGNVAPGDVVGGVNGVGTLTISSGTVTFGAASKVAISGSNATLDRLVLNAPVSVTSGAKIDFAGTSNLTQGRYSLITGSNGLAGFASDNTPSAYRLALSATEAAIVARPIQSVGSLQIGSGLSRVMQGQSLAFTGTASNSNASGGDALTLALTQQAGSNLSVSGLSAGSVASASSQQISGTVATGSTLGARTWGLTNTDNIATVSTASGSATINVLDNRTVTAGSVSFGLVRQNTTGSQSFSLTSSQPDSQYTRITVGNGAGGGFTVAGPGAFVFDGTGSSTGALSGTFSTAGTLSGTIGLTNTSAESGGSLTGQTPGATNVVYSASVFDGAGTWSLSSGGSWGSLASSNWTSTGNVGAAPGTFGAGYTTTDTATFGTAATGSSATVTIDTSAVSLASVVFNNATTRYVIAPGTGGGSFALAAASGKPTVNVTGIHEIATAIAGSNGLQKTGAGALVLSGSSNYTGGTDVSAGTLLVNGAIGGAVNVASGAVLGGSGSVAGLVTVLAGGTLSPGNSPGELTLGSLALNATSTTLMDINDIVRGTSYDGITITGSNGLTYGGVLSLVFGNGSAFTDNTTFNLFSFTGSPTGNFSSVTSSGFYAGNWTNNNDGTYQLQKDSQTLTFSQATGAVVVVPEPGALAIAGVGVILAGWQLTRRGLRERSCSTRP